MEIWAKVLVEVGPLIGCIGGFVGCLFICIVDKRYILDIVLYKGVHVGQYTLFRSFGMVSAILDVQMSHDHEHFGEVSFYI